LHANLIELGFTNCHECVDTDCRPFLPQEEMCKGQCDSKAKYQDASFRRNS